MPWHLIFFFRYFSYAHCFSLLPSAIPMQADDTEFYLFVRSSIDKTLAKAGVQACVFMQHTKTSKGSQGISIPWMSTFLLKLSNQSLLVIESHAILMDFRIAIIDKAAHVLL